VSGESRQKVDLKSNIREAERCQFVWSDFGWGTVVLYKGSDWQSIKLASACTLHDQLAQIRFAQSITQDDGQISMDYYCN
jgi:hypothetical protein